MPQKTGNADESCTTVLKNVDFSMEKGEFVTVIGRSGSGKSTLLNVLSTLILPDSGDIHFKGIDILNCPESERNALRRQSFAMIFQAHHLMPYLTASENILLPCMHSLKRVTKAQEKKAEKLLEQVGLAGRGAALPSQLSGGEQQRLAIARGLMNDAELLFADEPTGSLDVTTGNTIMDLLQDLNRNSGLSIIMVTHNPDYAKLANRTVSMSEGRVLG